VEPTLIFVFAMAGGSLYAIAAGNVSGWLWGGSENPHDGGVTGNETSMGWIDMGGGGTGNVTVNIPSADGNVAGYAWSEHYGWIDFNAVGNFTDYPGCGYPTTPCNSVERSGNSLAGWARVLSIRTDAIAGNSGGWEGWVQMNPAGGGVTINSDGTLTGYAWSGERDLGGGVKEGIGWIDFSQSSITIPKELMVCQSNCSSGSRMNTTSIVEGDSKTVVACYTDTVCADATSNVTSSSTWNEEYNSSINTVSLHGANPKEVRADQGVTGMETIEVEYDDPTDGLRSTTFDVTVVSPPPVCGDGNTDAGEECDEGGNNGNCPASCSTSCSSNDCRDYGWREVAP